MVRPHVLSMVLILLFVEVLWKQQRWKLLLISVVYPLAYTAAHFLVFIVIIYVTVLWVHQRKFKISFLLLTLAGITVGLVIHPQFPHNLKTWYVQNALLPVFNWGKSQEFWFVTEIKSLPLWSFMSVNGVTLLLFGIAMTLLILNRSNLSSLFFFILSLTTVFFVMTIFSMRFVEYWVPFSVISCALCLKAVSPVKSKVLKTTIKLGLFGLLSFSLVLYVLGVLLTPLHFSPKLEGVGHWLEANTPEKSVVFTSSWSYFPVLFYHNAKNHYLFGLDPVYCYAYDREIWNLWVAIVSGEVKNPSDQIKDVFGASYVLCTKDVEETEYSLTKQLLHENQNRIIYEDKYHLIFSLK